MLPTNARNAESTLAGCVTLAGLISMALLFPQIQAGAVRREEFVWLPSVGLNLVAGVDAFAWMFAMLVLGIDLLARAALFRQRIAAPGKDRTIHLN